MLQSGRVQIFLPSDDHIQKFYSPISPSQEANSPTGKDKSKRSYRTIKELLQGFVYEDVGIDKILYQNENQKKESLGEPPTDELKKKSLNSVDWEQRIRDYWELLSTKTIQKISEDEANTETTDSDFFYLACALSLTSLLILR